MLRSVALVPPSLFTSLAQVKPPPVQALTMAEQLYGERVIGLRCVTTPDDAQKVLLHRLGLRLPQRLRRADEIERM